MKNKKKLFITAMLIVVFLLIFSGCKKKSSVNNKDKQDNNKVEETVKEDVISPESTILTVGKTEIMYKELIIYILKAKSKYETTMTDKIWSYEVESGKTFEDVMKQEILDEISMLKILSQKAEEMEIQLDSGEKDEVRDYAANAYIKFSEDDRKKYGIDKETIEMYASDNYIAEKVYEVATNSVNTNVTDEEAKKIKVQYIYTEKKEDGELYLKQVKAAKKKKKFKSLTEEITDTDVLEEIIGKGNKEKAFEEAAFSLKTGGVTSLVEGEKGFYIIYCVSDFDEDATVANKEEIIKTRQEEAFEKQYTEWLNEYKIKINKKNLEKISFDNI